MQNRVRLKRLETNNPIGGSKTTLVIREIVDPKPYGRTSSELSSAIVVGSGVRLFPSDYSSDALFWDSVNETHLHVHGTSIDECNAGQPEFATDQDSNGAIQ